jgi:hypothetical protein
MRRPSCLPGLSASARNSTFAPNPSGDEADKNVSEFVLRYSVGKGDDEEDDGSDDEEGNMKEGTKASSGPRDGVVADRTPEGGADRKVPLSPLARQHLL